jgi:transcriptional regulator of arginine metabolism
MKNRNDRLMDIRRLVNQQSISSQEELLGLLENMGYSMTQATLSRDLKYLKVAKMPDNKKGYVYILTEHNATEVVEAENLPFIGFVSIDFAQGMGIVKTLPGHASSVAYALDTLNSYEIAGTIAGDDTILIIPRDGVTKSDLVMLFKSRIPAMAKETIM